MKRKILSLMLVGVLWFGFLSSAKADEYSETFNKVFPNGKYYTNSVEVKDESDLDVLVYGRIYNTIFPKLNMDDYGVMIDNCNSNYTLCDVELTKTANNAIVFREKHQVEFIYSFKQNVADEINKYLEIAKKGANSSQDFAKFYILEDIDLINYYSSLKSEEQIIDFNNTINYVSSLKKEFNNSNITYTMDNRAGDIMPMQSLAFGYFVAYYDNVIYGYVDGIGVKKKHIIYIPSDTENTKEAYIKAAKERLEKYLGNDVNITALNKRSDYDFSEYLAYNPNYQYDWNTLGDENLMGDYYYNVKINNMNYEFVIIRDSSKVKDFEYLSRDLNTNITVSSKSMIPLDTLINAKSIEDNKFYQDKLNKNNLYTFDIKLNSKSSNQSIIKLDNGKFLVGVPIPQNLLNKELIVQYINEDGSVENHNVKIEGNMAYFETDHFSTYSLGELNNTSIENPKTGDKIYKYIFLAGVSLIGTFALIVYIRKTNKKI